MKDSANNSAWTYPSAKHLHMALSQSHQHHHIFPSLPLNPLDPVNNPPSTAFHPMALPKLIATQVKYRSAKAIIFFKKKTKKLKSGKAFNFGILLQGLQAWNGLCFCTETLPLVSSIVHPFHEPKISTMFTRDAQWLEHVSLPCPLHSCIILVVICSILL